LVRLIIFKLQSELLCCPITCFQLWIAYNSISTYISVQRPYNMSVFIAATKMCVNVYDAMLFTDKLEFWWLFEVVLSNTCFILKLLFLWGIQAWWTSNNVIHSKLRINVKIQTVFNCTWLRTQNQNIRPPVHYRSYNNCMLMYVDIELCVIQSWKHVIGQHITSSFNVNNINRS
jgi:hypothetical protein